MARLEHCHEFIGPAGARKNLNSNMTSPKQQPQPLHNSHVQLVPASQFSIAELTHAYNLTRVDYLVPMPMTEARLLSYVKAYDIDMESSRVAIDGKEILGLAMLGVRPGHTWVTRLGVLPACRRAGIGEMLIRALLDETCKLDRTASILEVIRGNSPAHSLFRKMGFQDTRELLVLRRLPGSMEEDPPGQANWLEYEGIFRLLSRHPVRPAWTNEINTFIHTGDGQALEVNLGEAGWGWMVFRYHESLLSHFVLRTEQGDASLIARALIVHLYARFPHADTYIENIPATDAHFSTLTRLGFVDVFRRIEMEWKG